MIGTLPERIIRALEAICSLVPAAMMLLTLVDVIGRYNSGAPVFGANELISTMLDRLIFLGLGIANPRDRHIRGRALRHAGAQPCAPHLRRAGAGLLDPRDVPDRYVLYEQAHEAAGFDATTLVLEWPLSWITGSVAGLAALSVVRQILGLTRNAGTAAPRHMEDM